MKWWGIYIQKLTCIHLQIICVYFCLSKSFVKSCHPHIAFIEKPEIKALQWEAEADLLHGAVQQWQKCRQDYLLEIFQSFSETGYPFPQRMDNALGNLAVIEILNLCPVVWDVTRSWCSQWRRLHLNWSCRLPWQSVEGSWHLQSKNDAILKEILNTGQVTCSLIIPVCLQWPVHICIKLILDATNSSSVMLSCVWKGEEDLVQRT